MLASNIPPFFPIPWGNSAGAGFIRSIPTASQISITPGAASLTDGFPPLNFIPVSAGGIPPFGQDANGIFNEVTANLQYYQAGGTPAYNSAFSTAIGGYPNGALLASANGTGMWRSTVDNNVTNPDTGGAGWVTAFPCGVAGQVRNLAMTIAAASASATLTADEVIVETALGGQTYKLASFSKTINLATTGAGGMDTGTAPTSGFVALYAIYNPTTQTSALLATNAATLQPNVYGGANMPAGYTASALISVWPTNASKLFVIGAQVDRRVYIQPVTILSTTTTQSSFTSLSITSAAPLNAKTISGTMNASFSVTAGTNLNVQLATFAVSAIGVDTQTATLGGAAGTINSITGLFRDLPPTSSGFIAYVFTATGGSGQGSTVQIGNYTF